MKLQKQLSKRTRNKDYYRYVVNVPQMMIKESGFKEGEYLEIKAEKGRIILKKKDL